MDAKVALLQHQLRDVAQQLESERSLTTRTVENVAFCGAGGSSAPAHTPASIAGVSALAVVAATYVSTTAMPSPSSSALPHVPALVTASLAISVLTAATTQRVLPATASRMVNTDCAITQFLFAPPIEELPRGQDLLKSLYQHQCELVALRKETPATSQVELKYKKLVDKLTKAVEEKDRIMAEEQV